MEMSFHAHGCGHSEMTDFLRTSWRIPEVSHLRCAATQRGVDVKHCSQNRRCFAEMRCLWLAPHMCGTPIDKLPVERLVMQLQRLVEGVALLYTAKRCAFANAVVRGLTAVA